VDDETVPSVTRARGFEWPAPTSERPFAVPPFAVRPSAVPPSAVPCLEEVA